MKRFGIWFMLIALLMNFSSGEKHNEVTTGNKVEKQITDGECMAWWQEACPGMFVHWGIYSVPAGFY